MIISRTPYRISFFGGGTDYPEWYRNHGGEVLATTIDKYLYISSRYLPPFFDFRVRVAYSKIEECQNAKEIMHPAVREVFNFLSIENGLEIHYDGDLPGYSGMGSSSSFTVGLLNALYAYQGKMVNKHRLALESIHVEQNMIEETVGSQDQVSAAYGGLNHIKFQRNDDITVCPMTLTQERINELDTHIMLFYTGVIRTAEEVAKSYVENIESKEKQLVRMREMVWEAISILNSDQSLDGFGRLLHEAWLAKRSLSSMVSNPLVDDMYDTALKAGALGGKLSGAGGGGFLMLFVPPKRQAHVKEKLNKRLHVPFRFESNGSQIIFFNPQQRYLQEEEARSNGSISPFIELKQL